MTGGQRLILILGSVILLGVGLVLLSPGDDDEQSGSDATVTATVTTTTETPATTTETTTTETETTTTAKRPARKAPAVRFRKVRVSGGRPVGGVKTITVKSGRRVGIEVSSFDTSDEIHIHGYDLSKNLKAGTPVRFTFTANAEGIFEIELESRSTQIAKLVVEP